MTLRNLSRRCACAALAAAAFGAALPGHAQPGDAPAVPPRYRVELIVFANRDFNPSEELFEIEVPALEAARLQPSEDLFSRGPAFDQLLNPENPTQPGAPTRVGPAESVGPPSPGAANAPSPGAANAPLPGAEPAPLPEEPPFRLLAPEELTLGNVYRRLANDGRWSPVLHSGWVQNVVGEAQTEPVRLTRLGVHNPMGSISLYATRFLYLRLDVTYSEPRGTTFGGASSNFDGQQGGLRSLEPIVLPPRYRLEQSRQTRNGAVQYFDHPAFGVLVQVTEIPAAVPASGAARGRPAP